MIILLNLLELKYCTTSKFLWEGEHDDIDDKLAFIKMMTRTAVITRSTTQRKKQYESQSNRRRDDTTERKKSTTQQNGIQPNTL